MLVPLITTALFCIPYFLAEPYIISRYKGFDRQYIEEFYAWLPLLGLLMSYMMLFEYYLVSRMKVALSVAMREVLLRLLNVLLIALFYAGFLDFHQFVIGTVLVHVIPVAVLFALSKRTRGFQICFDWRVFNRKELYQIVHYAWYHLLLTVILNLNGMLDILLIGMLSPNGLADVAVYNIALLLISFLSIPFRAMSGAAFPRLNEAFIDKSPELDSLFTRSAVNIQLVTAAMWLLIAANLHNAVAILPKGYEAIAPAFLVLSLGRIIDLSTGLNTEVISITDHYKFTFRLSALLLISIFVLDRIFIPKYGLMGAAWVATGTLAAFNLAKLLFLYQKMKLLPFNKGSLSLLFACLLVFALNFILPAWPNPILDTIYRSLLLMIAYIGLLFLLRPSPDLTAYLAQIRKNKRLY
ncbi:MAG: polysaccharide biosynthesis C-terminal domain-containing protein [Bacteroidetes bacterium]|nr:polysaccharide biosynthesis C-terminal domain-containing protein [Bacteroidota bacterium]MBS1628732.1 polysaccharide biosynthesis C-terminal domain-containing protein [Bacteroidota bacterium]